MSNFKKIAQDTTVLCPLMSGREKLDTDDVVGKKFTIVAFDFAPKFDKSGAPIVDEFTGESDVYGVLVFKEKPNNYYNVGVVFTKVCKAWMVGYDSPEAASADLAAEGGVAVKFEMTHTKSGNNLVNVQII